MSVEGTVKVEHSPAHCPFCKGALEDLGKVVACAACGARHHEACRAEHGRCATCGAQDLLVPRAPRRRALEPPPGSKLAVRNEGDRVVIELPRPSFDPSQAPAVFVFVLGALFALLLSSIRGAPVVLPVMGGILVLAVALALLAKRRHRGPVAPELALGPDAIEFPGQDVFFGFPVPVRATRAQLGTAKAESRKEGYVLFVDVGLTRWRVALTGRDLKEPEVDWIAATIRAWRDEA